jgi:hypothetical protein
MITKIKNMNTPFTLGQIVSLKNYKRNELEKEAYFVVIEENDDTNELVLYTLNTNRYFKSGDTIEPEYPEITRPTKLKSECKARGYLKRYLKNKNPVKDFKPIQTKE